MDWLEAKLRSVGKESFEHDYDIYKAYGTVRCSRVDSVKAPIGRGRSENENGAGWRLGAAKAIFEAGMPGVALHNARN